MTKRHLKLLRAKKIILNKIDLDKNLLNTIQQIKQDEKNLKEECTAYELILKLLDREIGRYRWVRKN